MANIVLPNDWMARAHQKPLLAHMLQGGMEQKRAACVWHRRAGKDSASINLASVASQMRVGTYWHLFPTLRHGRKALWEYIDYQGRRTIDQAIPKEMREGPPNETDMRISLANGSVYQVVGSDNYNSLVGANPVGVIFSEYSVADPTAWDYIRPILLENKGWAIFIYTPRGRNHGFMLKKMAETNPRWFYSVLTVDETFREDGSPIVTHDMIDEERRSGMSEEKIQQEYYCSFEGGLEGAYFTNEILRARKEGRIGFHPHDPRFPCQTWWDIGWKDQTVIIITQRNSAGYPDIIDCLHARNRSLPDWIRDLRQTPYDFDENWGPHDIDSTEWGVGKTRLETAADLGFHFNIVPKLAHHEGIEMARQMIAVCRFHEDKTDILVDGLLGYHRVWDELNQRFSDKAQHDWASDYADAFRYLAVGWVHYGGRERKTSRQHKVIRAAGTVRLTHATQ